MQVSALKASIAGHIGQKHIVTIDVSIVLRLQDRNHAIDQSSAGSKNLLFTTFFFPVSADSAAGTPTAPSINTIVGYESEERCKDNYEAHVK